LEVCLPDTVERACFQSREEALDHAKAIIGDYANVMAVLLDPDGKPEKIATKTATQI
jgi:hypothetical protein